LTDLLFLIARHSGNCGAGFSAWYLKVPAKHLSLILLANSEG